MKVALVGSPNGGKTSLFNWLTGSRFKTVNYAGATVESHRGKSLPVYGETFEVIDTPGVYSLYPGSQDEKVTVDILTKGDLDRVILVLDSTQLKRHLLLALQLKAVKVPFVVALTMEDLLRKKNLKTDIRRLGEILQSPVAVVDGRLGGGVKPLTELVRGSSEVFRPDARAFLDIHKKTESFAAEGRKIAQKVVSSEEDEKKFVSEKNIRLDRIFLHSPLSLPIFVAVMTLLFISVFFLAAPLMDMVDEFFSFASEGVEELFGESGGMFTAFLTSGLIEGLGAVLVFVPQIFILFVGLSFLEESGYLARASTLIDRPLHAVGLSGRSFVPLLSGFACAVPAVMATRNLKSPRERWIAVFILPFMTCSARLPVYALLLAFLFFGDSPWKPGFALAGIYFGSLIIGGMAALILNLILRGKERSFFLMELPPYRVPRFSKVVLDSLRRTKTYVFRVGPVILTFVLILWATTHFPYDSSWNETEQLRNSMMGHIGHWLEPIFKPMGLDWRGAVALLSAFVAREVFVSAMAVIYNLTSVSEESLQGSLIEQMKQATFDTGELIFTTPSVVALIVFFMLALQCLSTTGVVIKEMGSWRYGMVQLVIMNVVAYVCAVFTFQILTWLI